MADKKCSQDTDEKYGNVQGGDVVAQDAAVRIEKNRDKSGAGEDTNAGGCFF